ncbi:hypothetical protein MM213_20270 [Belliella sp. R4-6]|uniref:Immunity protein 63 domain-containing protein n=1 Tax=Belliella alkalica TaxID=1730871 RepID=A0ABS9VHD0_9BACT|nr:hypothetical protein [Belliella alkalica]MCH7415847.1 hypothetical protein [Belliella alkalica]
MTIKELHKRLEESGISEDQYFLHGLFGSNDDNDKIGLTIRQGQNGLEYETFYKERGEKHSIRTFTTEKEACEHIFKKLIDEQTLYRIQKIVGLSGMTVNERLWESGLMDEFDRARKKDKTRAKEILRWLRVDEPSILKIVK